VLALALAACGEQEADSTHSTTGPTTPAPALPVLSRCGVERWAVKTLTDPDASRVNLTPTPTTLAKLIAVGPPATEPGTERLPPIETATFTLSATLVYGKREADRDYHLVLEDTGGRTMIVEAPEPACVPGSRVLKQITTVRKALNEHLPELPKGRTDKPFLQVTVTGVGFFDRLHGQTGVAPNGIELHPLTSITFTSDRPTAPSITLTEHGGTD